MGCGQGTGQSDRKQQSRNREDRTQWAADKGPDKMTGNSRAGIERTGAWVEEIWRKLQLK